MLTYSTLTLTIHNNTYTVVKQMSKVDCQNIMKPHFESAINRRWKSCKNAFKPNLCQSQRNVCIPIKQGSSNLSLEVQSAAEFSSNPPTCDFLMILKTLISMLRCVWLELELNSAGMVQIWGPLLYISGFQTCPGSTPALLILYVSLTRHTWFRSCSLYYRADEWNQVCLISETYKMSRAGLKITAIHYI